MKQKLFLTLALLMTVCSSGMAKEAYAVYNDGTLTFYYDTSKNSRTGDKYALNAPGSDPDWYTDHANDIKKVVFKPSFKDARPTSTSWWFAADEDENWNILSQLTTITGIQYLNTSEVVDMSYMFYNCNKLTTIDVSNFDMSKVTTTEEMFYFCEALRSLDVSNWNTSNITNMSGTFNSCIALETLDVSNWNTSKVKNMEYLFFYCSILTTLDVSNWNTANVENMNGIFNGCQNVTSLDVSKWNTAKVTDMSSMFDECYKLTSIDVSKWNTASVTSMCFMFYQCKQLTNLDLSSFNTTNVTDMNHMFSWDSKLTTIYVGELWDIKNLSATSTWSGYENGWVDMFEGCYRLKGEKGTIYDGSHTGKDYAHVDEGPDSPNPGYLSSKAYAVLSDDGKTLTFYYNTNKSSFGTNAYGLNTNYNYPGWYKDWSEGENPNKITKVVFDSSFKVACPTSTYHWFAYQEQLTEITGIEYLNTSQVTNMYAMFNCCMALKYVELSGFDTQNVEDMSSMFNSCYSLTRIDLSRFKTSKVTNMDYMFYDCSSITNLNVSKFDTSSVTDMYCMFSGCSNLTSLNLSNFKTDKVTASMACMFEGCSNLVTLDLTSFNTSNVSEIYLMFNGCTELKTIYVGDQWNINSSASGYSMFDGCISLVGGNGTTYDESNTGKEYAHIDGIGGPGYLTAAPVVSIATSLNQVKSDKSQVTSDEWYTIDGRKLNGMPAKKGIYIHNGKKGVVH